jgi:hypothetical protein
MHGKAMALTLMQNHFGIKPKPLWYQAQTTLVSSPNRFGIMPNPFWHRAKPLWYLSRPALE